MRQLNTLFLADLVILGWFVGLAAKSVSADIGPKASVGIDIVYNQTSVPDVRFSAEMLRCSKEKDARREYERATQEAIPQLKIFEYDPVNGCYWHPDWNAWHRECQKSLCRFGYNPPDPFKLAVFLPSVNRVFITPEISRPNFRSRFRAELFEDGTAKIFETTPLWWIDTVHSFLKALFITILLELLVSSHFVSKRGLPKKILGSVLFANLVSLPVVWFLFPWGKGEALLMLVMAEFFAVLFETAVVYVANKKVMSLTQSLALNVQNNLVSFLIGGYVYFFLGYFL